MTPSERAATISLMLNVGGTEEQKFEIFKNEFTKNLTKMMGDKEGRQIASEVLAIITQEEYIGTIRSAFETASDTYLEFFKKMYEMDKEGTEVYNIESVTILQDISARVEEMMKKKVMQLNGFSIEDIDDILNNGLFNEEEPEGKDPRESWEHFKGNR